MTMFIRQGEFGENQPILIQQCMANVCTSCYTAADSTITFKPLCDFCTTTLTVTSTDFTFSVATVTWTPTSAQLTTLGVGDKAGFVTLNNNACCRTAIARFCLTILDV